MRSSTSSSDPASAAAAEPRAATPGGRVWRMAIAVWAPSLLVAFGLILGAALLQRRAPSGRLPIELEKLIVRGQVQRAARMAPAEILVLGDSSALMGIDPTLLASRTGRSVQSLATLAWVGPAGEARLLDEAVAAMGRAPAEIVVLFNHASLELDEGAYAALGYERSILEGARVPRRGMLRDLVADARVGVLDDVIRAVVALPLPGSYGRRYGWPDDLVAALGRNHGGLVDPNQLVLAGSSSDPGQAAPPPIALFVSAAFERRLPALRDAIARAGPGRVHFSLTPVAARLVDAQTLVTRRQVTERVLQGLALTAAALVALPPSLLESEMATATHPNEAGRERLTLSLAAALR